MTSAPQVRVLVVDNHDSFVHTLIGYLRELGAIVDVRESDEIPDAAAAIAGYDGVMVSPGPGSPDDAGASIEIVHAAARSRISMLGVCLGHQVLARAFGARVAEAPELMHGMTSQVIHGRRGVFQHVPQDVSVARYHSLAVSAESLPPEMEITAVTASGTVMGIAHRTLPLQGVQFHPESVLTEHGYVLLATWLESLGVADAVATGRALSPHRGTSGAYPVQTVSEISD